MKKYLTEIKKAITALSLMPFTFAAAQATTADNNAFSAMTGPLEQIMNLISGPIAQLFPRLTIFVIKLRSSSSV